MPRLSLSLCVTAGYGDGSPGRAASCHAPWQRGCPLGGTLGPAAIVGGDIPLDPTAALQSLLTAVLGPDPQRPTDLDELTSRWRAAIHGKDALLFLDNAADAAQVRPLLPGSSTCAVLVTSRHRFTLPGPPLLDMEPLPSADARDLLQRLAPRLDEDAADQIAVLCDRLPLALRIAGSYLALNDNVTPGRYAELLADEKKRLPLLSDPDDPKLNVQATIALSLKQLDDEIRHAWALLSLFPAPFDAPAAAALWGRAIQVPLADLPQKAAALLTEGASEITVLGVRNQETLARLQSLRNCSLVSYDCEANRYHQHDLLRLAAARDLEAVTEYQISAARDRLAQHYRNRAIEVKKTQRYLDLDPDWPHLRAALEYAAARDDDSSTMLLSDLVYALNDYLNVRGLARERVTWCQHAAHACAKTDRHRDEGAHLGNLGQAYAALGEVRQAMKHYEAWVAISRRIGNRHAEAEGLNNLGNAYYRLGETRMAIEYYEGALAIAREIGDRRNQPNYLGNLGFACQRLGEVRRAIEYHRDALVIARETGDRRIAETTLGNMGISWSSIGETGSAIKCYEAALDIARKIGDRRGEGAWLGRLGNAYKDLEEVRQAIEYHEAALAVAREIGDRPGEGAQLGNLGDAYKELGKVLPGGDRPGAINYYEAALDTSREISDRYGEAQALRNLGLAYAALGEVLPDGDRPGAIKCYEGAMDILRDIGNRQGEGIVLGNLGIAYWRLGDLRQATEYSEAALAIAREIGDRQSEANQLYNLALLTVRQWQPLRSGQLWFQALAVYQTIHNPHAQTMLRGMSRGCIEIVVLIGALLLLIALIVYALIAGPF